MKFKAYIPIKKTSFIYIMKDRVLGKWSLEEEITVKIEGTKPVNA